ncbi:MAG TPA: NUDIX hydrolase [Anaerolineales bacterium]|jgi:8-oxo-dGTP diphosphatase|nr:NUDIX hydrolase [Anaerolineales bacterium]HQX15425.1 NUDIX hydrolase [Anaerolineales bacterium]
MTNQTVPMHIVAVAAFVTNSQGQVLLLKSPRYGDWEFPGGQVEESETLTHALEREVFEETGIIVRPVSLVGVYSNTRKPSILMLDFICEYVSGEPKISAESSQVEWVDRNEALSRVKRQAIHGRLKNMLEFSGEVTYRAYFVDPNRIDLNYAELEDRKI